jgi:hypothetical protein
MLPHEQKGKKCQAIVIPRKPFEQVFQSVPITIKVVSSNPVHGEVYSKQHYMIKFVSDLRQVGGFSPVSSTNKFDRHDRTEILLKVRLSTINHNHVLLDLHRESQGLFHSFIQIVKGEYKTCTIYLPCDREYYLIGHAYW